MVSAIHRATRAPHKLRTVSAESSLMPRAYLGGGGQRNNAPDGHSLDVTLLVYNFICLIGTMVTKKSSEC